MKTIAFVDAEIEPKSRKILDIGSVKGDGSSFHKTSVTEFMEIPRNVTTLFRCKVTTKS
ncbi:MAG TPA: hypothetical protein VKQ08_03960 [Cyclobacteriaceae bacterium]|nr:hypothetical protein [Cyclobacteriaceae bacterium]